MDLYVTSELILVLIIGWYSRIEEKASAKKAYNLLLEEIWGEFLKLPEDELSEIINKTEVLHYFAKEGNDKILAKILHRKPHLLWTLNSKGQSILHVAVIHRQKEVFDLINDKKGHCKDLIILQQDDDKNNILHLTAKLGWPSYYQYPEDDKVRTKQLLFFLNCMRASSLFHVYVFVILYMFSI